MSSSVTAGMITDARIAEDIQPAGLDWITALRAPAIRGLLDGGAFTDIAVR